MHPFLKSTLNKVQDFVADPKVTTSAKVVRGCIEVASQIGQAKLGGPVAVAGAIIGTLNVIQTTLGVEKYNACDEWVKKQEKLDRRMGSFPRTLEAVGALDFLPLVTYVQNVGGSEELRGFEHDGKMFVFRFTGSEGARKVSGIYYAPGDFDYTVFSQAMWRALVHPIVKMTETKGSTTDDFISCEADPYDSIPYIGKNSPEAFAATVEKYRAKGISRAYLLVGPPGTGKTSFVRAYARDTKQTLMVVPPDFLNGSSRVLIERLVRILQPNILLIDDIDRASAGLPYAMNMVDDLRRLFPRMVVITTVNQITKTNAALLRPGRLGKRLKFDPPPLHEKVALLKLYMKLYGVDAAEFDLAKLADAMTHKRFSHDYVRFTAEEAVSLNMEELLESIEQMNELLEISNILEPSLSDLQQLGESSGVARLRTSAAPMPTER